MKCYIDFLDCTNNFQKKRKDFGSYDDAIAWMRSTFEKCDVDMICYY